MTFDPLAMAVPQCTRCHGCGRSPRGAICQCVKRRLARAAARGDLDTAAARHRGGWSFPHAEWRIQCAWAVKHLQ
mgnify:CR=1 FL=1